LQKGVSGNKGCQEYFFQTPMPKPPGGPQTPPAFPPPQHYTVGCGSWFQPNRSASSAFFKAAPPRPQIEFESFLSGIQPSILPSPYTHNGWSRLLSFEECRASPCCKTTTSVVHPSLCARSMSKRRPPAGAPSTKRNQRRAVRRNAINGHLHK